MNDYLESKQIKKILNNHIKLFKQFRIKDLDFENIKIHENQGVVFHGQENVKYVDDFKTNNVGKITIPAYADFIFYEISQNNQDTKNGLGKYLVLALNKIKKLFLPFEIVVSEKEKIQSVKIKCFNVVLTDENFNITHYINIEQYPIYEPDSNEPKAFDEKGKRKKAFKKGGEKI